MSNKIRLKEQSSPEPIIALSNNKPIKITYIYIYISALMATGCHDVSYQLIFQPLESTHPYADVHATWSIQNAENKNERLLQGPVIA